MTEHRPPADYARAADALAAVAVVVVALYRPAAADEPNMQ